MSSFLASQIVVEPLVDSQSEWECWPDNTGILSLENHVPPELQHTAVCKYSIKSLTSAAGEPGNDTLRVKTEPESRVRNNGYTIHTYRGIEIKVLETDTRKGQPVKNKHYCKYNPYLCLFIFPFVLLQHCIYT